jgi:hypothetical protein
MNTLTKVSEPVSQIEQWLKEAKLEISNIENRIKPELEKLEKCRKKIELYQKLLEIEKPRLIHRQERFARKSSKIADLAVEVLQEAQKSLHYTEIMEKIESGGIEIPGENKKSNMTAHLANDDRIARAKERGFYKLKEWEDNKENPQLEVK